MALLRMSTRARSGVEEGNSGLTNALRADRAGESECGDKCGRLPQPPMALPVSPTMTTWRRVARLCSCPVKLEKRLALSVRGDTQFESNEVFYLNLSLQSGFVRCRLGRHSSGLRHHQR